MNLRRLYRTIESFASEHFKTDKEVLKHILNEIVKDENISIKGGRIWQYEQTSESYRLVHQIGVIEKVEIGYKIPVAQYPMFQALTEQRTIIAHETDKYLRKKGIVKYSATGVGEKIAWKNGLVYQYVLAFNSDFLDQTLQADLNIISLAASSVLRGRKIERKAKLLEMDIDKAREIQLNILPDSAFTFFDYQIYGISQPDRIVGGDFFDYLYTDSEEDRLGIVIGDAASKGFRAASQALYVVGAIRMGTSYHTKISSLISRINRIVNKAFAEEQFVSMFYAELSDNKKGLLLYSNAGHNSPFVYHASTKVIEVLEPTGQILGPFPDENFRVENTYLQKGDVCLMYTDGVSEARGSDGGAFGEKRIEQSLTALHTLTAKEICVNILNEVNQFSQDSDEYSDDKSIVVIKRS
jgi:sigma-B regulation protein RsbU (phosphoserine phosphatase)